MAVAAIGAVFPDTSTLVTFKTAIRITAASVSGLIFHVGDDAIGCGAWLGSQTLGFHAGEDGGTNGATITFDNGAAWPVGLELELIFCIRPGDGAIAIFANGNLLAKTRSFSGTFGAAGEWADNGGGGSFADDFDTAIVSDILETGAPANFQVIEPLSAYIGTCPRHYNRDEIGPVGPEPPSGFRYWRVLGGINLGGNSQYSELELRDGPSGTDLVGSGTPSASSEFSVSFEVENLFDGDTGTAWAASGHDMQYVDYDFGDGNDQDVQEIMLQYTTTPSQGWGAVTVLYSADDVTYTPVAFHNLTNNGSLNQEVLDVTPQGEDEPDLDVAAAHRYWRWLCTEMVATSFFQVNEFTLTNGSSSDLTTDEGGTASSSSEQGSFPSSAAFDRSDATRWATNSVVTAPWIQWDFGSGNDQAVTGYKIKSYTTTEAAPSGWKLQCSDNGTTWKTVDWKSQQAAWSSNEERTFSV